MPISVILADDHAIIRQGLAPLLSAGDDLELLAQAANGREAWRLIAELRPDVAILDISMPEMTGIEVASRTEEAGLDTRVVLLTMHEDPCAVLQAQEAGAVGYVLKDNSFEELVAAVKTVAAGGTFVTPAVRARLRELRRNGYTTPTLSNQEREVLRLIALGNSSKEAARIMNISPRTVDTYRNRLMDKLGLHTLADVVRYAVRTGMVS
ncbi:MAG: response regulator transcription factor [Pseudomonadota bacterium]|nr:response regulator transcription factor [Pseudomonadota bacterium]